MKRKDLSNATAVIYEVGPWFVQVNHQTRRCYLTSGDCWYDISREEAVRFLRG